MSKPFDATLNALIDLRPDEWAKAFAALAGIPPGPSISLDTDLATTLQADKLFRVDGPRPAVLHLELEANPRLGIPRELLRYNTLIDHQQDLPVHTVLILLRPKAAASDQTGRYERLGVHGIRIAEFRYHVERVWERPVEFWLSMGLGLSPLAMLTDEASDDLESALDRFQTCLDRNAVEESVAKSLLGSTFVLCGLRNPPDRVEALFRRLSMLMEESTTYQLILNKGLSQGLNQGLSQGRNEGRNEGRSEEARALILRQGTKRFGPPTPTAMATLDSVVDLVRLEELAMRVLDANGWDDLLQTE